EGSGPRCAQACVGVRAGLRGRLATCGGLVTRLPTFANGRPAPAANRRAGYHPAPPRPPGVTGFRALLLLCRGRCGLFAHLFEVLQPLASTLNAPDGFITNN